MKGIVCVLLLAVGMRIVTTRLRSQWYSINYRIQNRVVPIRIEFHQNRQVEYIMNLHSNGDGKSVTFYDFNRNIVIYKELTARECYITRLTDETLEKERAQLEEKKNSILDSSVETTLYASNVLLSVAEIQDNAGSRGVRFCRGMSSYLVGGARRRRHRSRRQTGPFIQRSYGHFGQQTINYSHYGHETYTLGNFGNKILQVLQNGTAGNTRTDSLGYPIFILLPLSGQFGVKTTHSGGYQLHLPVGQAKASYSGGINSEANQISQPKKNNLDAHSWNTFERISNSTDFPAMIIIPGMPPLTFANGSQAPVIPLQELASKRNDEAKTSSFILTTLNNNNNKVLGSSKIENQKVSMSGDSKGQGSFNAQSEYISNASALNSRITGGPTGANASISASILGKGSFVSNAITQALDGRSYADSNLDFGGGKAYSQAKGDQRSSDAKSRAAGDRTLTNTQSEISASQNNARLLTANASASHRDKSGKVRANIRNKYPSSTTASNALSSYADSNDQQHEGIISKEPNVIKGTTFTSRRTFSPFYSTKIRSPFEKSAYWRGAQKALPKQEILPQRPVHSKTSLTKSAYPTVLVEDVKFPQGKRRNTTELKLPKSPYAKQDTQQKQRNISLFNGRHYFDLTYNKPPPTKHQPRSNRTINKLKSQFSRSKNESARGERSHWGLRGRSHLDGLRASNVSAARQYHIKNSVASKITGKRCCSQKHLLRPKKYELRPAERGCCGRIIYYNSPERTGLAHRKNCKRVCYFVYRTTERIRICKANSFNVC